MRKAAVKACQMQLTSRHSDIPRGHNSEVQEGLNIVTAFFSAHYYVIHTNFHPTGNGRVPNFGIAGRFVVY